MAKVKNSGKQASGGRDVRRTAQAADERRGKTRSKTVKAKGAKARPPAKTPGRDTTRSTRKAESAKSPTQSWRGAAPRGAAKADGSTSRGRSGGSKERRPPLRLIRGGAKPEPVVQLRIRELDPLQKCGAATSVERLIRVDEIVGKALTAHLVFLDHHGWYCEHGQGCPAVAHARKHAKQVRSPHDRNGTPNGRMRA